MAEKKQSTEKEETAEEKPKSCFVIMPISDVDGYEAGHFKRVYEHIIKPACENAGFAPFRADDINTTNHIIIDILKRIVEADMTICDLSSRNPNVLYELGIRQAFNRPVTLIKDERTSRIFDIQTLRDVPYNSSLRIDTIEQVVPMVADALKSTYENKDDSINSIVQLLGIEAAKVTKTEVSKDTELLLNAINNLGKRISKVEDTSNYRIAQDRYLSLSNKLKEFYVASKPNNDSILGVKLEFSTKKDARLAFDVIKNIIKNISSLRVDDVKLIIEFIKTVGLDTTNDIIDLIESHAIKVLNCQLM